MIELLYEYKRTLRETKKLRDKLKANANTPEDEEDLKLYSLMISDLQYIIEWIGRGRQPYAKRGIDRREAYRRLIFTDEETMSAIGRPLKSEAVENSVSELDRERIEDVLSVLTNKEKDIFFMNKVEQLSYERIAELIGVKKTTVQSHINRCEVKMRKQMDNSMFSMIL
ncbi:sigma factor-like helix-turn-helix DNA-binding protein [Halobacillus salinus]|nr:sigma factor-like helix-turn-helix DNA-binding protein [Halobacillus salinus]